MWLTGQGIRKSHVINMAEVSEVESHETDSCLDSMYFCDSDIEDETCSSSSNTTNSSGTSTIFNSLRAPKPSELARKRISRNNPPPPNGKRRSSSRGNCDPKNVTPSQRVKENVNEELCVSNGKLFCNACREELSLKATVLKNHLKSTKHDMGKKRLQEKRIYA